MNTTRHNFFVSMLAAGAIFLMTSQVWAMNIDTSDKYAWGENIGWINFGTTEGDVDVSATGIEGYAWGENVGWISLNCSNDSSCATVDYGVEISGSDVSGYAWGENVGWIDFNPTYGGVSVDTSTGIFSGYAWGENVGWISFNCSDASSCATVDYKVKTTLSFSTGSSRVNRHPTPEPEPATPPSVSESPSPSVTPSESPIVTVTPEPSYSPFPTPPIPTPLISESPLPPIPSPFPTPTSPPPYPASPEEPGESPIVEIISGIGGIIDDFSSTVFGYLSNVVANTCGDTAFGVVSCGATSVVTVAVATAVAAAAMQNEVAASTFSLLQVIGIRKRAKVWGVVYDAKTKRPIPLAKIELYDAAGRILETRFADRDGRYGFLTSPASLHEQELHLHIRVQKPGYKFPSAFTLAGTDYVVYDHIYRGEEIVLSGDSVIRFNIPLDPVSGAGASFSVLGRGFFGAVGEKLLSLGFYVGLVTVPLNVYFAPTTKSIAIAAIFVLMNGIRMFAIYRPYGMTRDALTGKPLPFALVTINDTQGNRQGFAVSDEYGRFILSGEKNKDYQLEAYTPANIIPQRSIKRTVRGIRRWTTRAWITADVRI